MYTFVQGHSGALYGCLELDRSVLHADSIRTAMQGVFDELGLAA